MGELRDKVAFLQGMAEGMALNPDTPEHKLLLKMLDVLKDFSQELEDLGDAHEELTEYVDNIDDDLGMLEEMLFEDEFDDDFDGIDDEDDDHAPLEGEMEYECPHCGFQTKFDLAEFDFEEDYLCPQCHKSFFPEVDDDEEDEGDN